MKPERIIHELELELTKMGIRVRREKGNFKGGWCIINDERCLMLNRRHSAEMQFSVLAEAVRSLPLDTVYLKPNVRTELERQWSRKPGEPAADTDE
jgi:hypothetical protein